MHRNLLTTEHLRKKFKNNFNLCNFSINIGRNHVLSGEPSNLALILKIVGEQADIEEEKSKNLPPN